MLAEAGTHDLHVSATDETRWPILPFRPNRRSKIHRVMSWASPQRSSSAMPRTRHNFERRRFVVRFSLNSD